MNLRGICARHGNASRMEKRMRAKSAPSDTTVGSILSAESLDTTKHQYWKGAET